MDMGYKTSIFLLGKKQCRLEIRIAQLISMVARGESLNFMEWMKLYHLRDWQYRKLWELYEEGLNND